VTPGVFEAVRFTVTREDRRHARRLAVRTSTLIIVGALIAIGLGIFILTRSGGGLVVIGLAVLALIDWRFPILDRWFDRGRPAEGSVCEIAIDDDGVVYRQIGAGGSFDTSGHISWALMTGIKEDKEALLIMDGRIVRIGIPKRAFTSREQLDLLRSAVQQHATRGSR